MQIPRSNEMEKGEVPFLSWDCFWGWRKENHKQQKQIHAKILYFYIFFVFVQDFIKCLHRETIHLRLQLPRLYLEFFSCLTQCWFLDGIFIRLIFVNWCHLLTPFPTILFSHWYSPTLLWPTDFSNHSIQVSFCLQSLETLFSFLAFPYINSHMPTRN